MPWNMCRQRQSRRYCSPCPQQGFQRGLHSTLISKLECHRVNGHTATGVKISCQAQGANESYSTLAAAFLGHLPLDLKHSISVSVLEENAEHRLFILFFFFFFLGYLSTETGCPERLGDLNPCRFSKLHCITSSTNWCAFSVDPDLSRSLH